MEAIPSRLEAIASRILLLLGCDGGWKLPEGSPVVALPLVNLSRNATCQDRAGISVDAQERDLVALDSKLR